MSEKNDNVLGIISLVCGIASLAFALIIPLLNLGLALGKSLRILGNSIAEFILKKINSLLLLKKYVKCGSIIINRL